MKLLYLAAISGSKNSTPYQRARILSQRHDLIILLRKNSSIPKDIEHKSDIIRSSFEFLPLFHLWRSIKILQMSRKNCFDSVYTLYQPSSIILGFFLKTMGYKWVADIWDHPEQITLFSSSNIFEKLVKSIGLFFVKNFLRCSDLVILALVPKTLVAYNLDETKITSITNGVDLESLSNIQNKKIEKYKFKIFYVGPVYKIRRVDVLLDAIKELKIKYNLPLELILAGKVETKMQHWIDNYIQKNKLESSVKILGQIEHDEVLNLMKKADVCVCPLSKHKTKDCTYPIKILEYLAMGKPVVSVNLKGISQLIKNGKNGILTEPDNPKEMAEAILKIYEDKKLKKKLEIRAKRSSYKYEWSEINEKITNALGNLSRNL